MSILTACAGLINEKNTSRAGLINAKIIESLDLYNSTSK